MWKKLGWGLLIINLLILDGVMGYGWWVMGSRFTDKDMVVNNRITEYQDICGTDCQEKIRQQVTLLKNDLMAGQSGMPKATVTSVPSATPKPIYLQPTQKVTKTQTVSYLTIPGNGSSQNNSWADLSGTEFYFNPADYPGLKAVYFEANMKLFNGNGMAYIRLLDATHGIGVQGSDVSTNNQANTIVTSGQVTFWAGKNLIKVQGKSLTADTAVFNSGRLKIVQEN